jgi:hypothetical protein
MPWMDISHEYVIVLMEDNLTLQDTMYNSNKFTTVPDNIITCKCTRLCVIYECYAEVVYNNPYV